MIRPERPGDEDVIRIVETAAFGKEREARIVDRIRASDAFIPELSLVAEEAGAIVGHVIVSLGRVEPGGEEVHLLGPIGVAPVRQNHGIGGGLVRAALEGAADRGASCVALIGAPEYYERFGFVQAEPLGLLPPGGWPSRPFQVAVLDREAGPPQGRVAYPDAFD